MIPPSCKRLAEVDFPIAEVSRHAAREKSIRHGHTSTLHLWWTRRLASGATCCGQLPARVGDWMERLQGEGVRGSDLVFACVGPALELYSR